LREIARAPSRNTPALSAISHAETPSIPTWYVALIAGSHAWVSWKCSGRGPPVALFPGIQSRSKVTMTATASVAKMVRPFTAAVRRRGTSCSRMAAPAGMTISRVSLGLCFIAR
jgi:hypothetical protein